MGTLKLEWKVTVASVKKYKANLPESGAERQRLVLDQANCEAVQQN
jgi:hypothetical protein